MKRITTSEVAKAAGVSIGAASVVLNGGTKKIGVSEKTRARILRAAAKLGYRLNPAARATRTGKFGSVALLLGRIDYNSLVSGSRLSCILDATEKRNLSLTLTRADDEKLSDERFLHDLLARIYADGLLIGYNADLPPLFGLRSARGKQHSPRRYSTIPASARSAAPSPADAVSIPAAARGAFRPPPATSLSPDQQRHPVDIANAV